MAAPAVAGYSWSQTTIPPTLNGSGGAFDGKFIWAGGEASGLWYSLDGVTWTEANSSFDGASKFAFHICATESVAVVYGQGGSGVVAAYSTDGVTWTDFSVAGIEVGHGYAFAGIHLYRVSGGWRTSTDGTTWTLRSGAPGGDPTTILTFNGLYLWITSGGIYSSSDLNTWTLRQAPPLGHAFGPAAASSNVAVAIAYNAGGNKVFTSEDGVSWTDAEVDPLTLPVVCYDMAYSSAEGKFIAAGGDPYSPPIRNGPIISASSDGVVWEVVASSGADRAVVYGLTLLPNGGHYCVGYVPGAGPGDEIVRGAYNTLAGWKYDASPLGAGYEPAILVVLASNGVATLMVAYVYGSIMADCGFLLSEEPTPFGEVESSAEASSTTEGMVMIDASAESTADAQSSCVAELGGRAATLGYTATAASVLAAQPIIVVVELGSGDLTSDALATLVRTATHNGAASAGATATGSPVLVATSYGLISGNSTLRRDGSPSEVWVITEGTGAISRYRDYDFTSFGRLDGRHYGISEDGVYSLDEDTSDELAWSVDLGEQWFSDTLLSRLSHAYMGVSSSGTVYVRVEIGEQEYLYQARAMDPVRQTQRFDFGLGLRAACYELVAVGEGQAEVSSVEFVAVPLTRRI